MHSQARARTLGVGPAGADPLPLIRLLMTSFLSVGRSIYRLKGNKDMTLSLHWNIIPNAGALPRRSHGKTTFSFPNSYH